MRAALCGLGKLGLPVAVAFTEEHRVLGHDVNPELMKLRPYEQREEGFNGHTFQELFEESVEGGFLRFASLEECVQQSEIIFVAVQTPHKPELDGTHRLTDERADFDYAFLKDAVGKVARIAKLSTHRPVLAIISTVLPGTVRREVLPLVDGILPVVYCPFFAAMGTVVRDVLDPEFILLGGEDITAKGVAQTFFKSLCPDAPQVSMSFESAELTKVAYNLYISRKLEYINILTEVAHGIPGCDVQDVSNVLSLSHRRLLSPAYLKPGGAEGGACLTGDTPVSTPKGLLPIRYLAEEFGRFDVFSLPVKDGSNHLGKDAERRQAVNIRKTRTDQRIVRVLFDDGKHIDCTPDHRFLVARGQHVSMYPVGDGDTEAWDLIPGQSVVALWGERTVPVKVMSVSLLRGRHDVYCLEVPETGWFFANGILVHNCHPRDAIAMSWLADELLLSSNPFEVVMESREHHVRWLAGVICQKSKEHRLPICILGKSFKADSSITAGSYALLLANILTDWGVEFYHHDPLVDDLAKGTTRFDDPWVVFVATRHEVFAKYKFAPGSVVLDPHRFINPQDGVEVIRIGEGKAT